VVVPASGRSVEAAPKGTREKLLDAGLEAFGERGFDGVTAREIERLAGVERGLLKYHCGSKLELWTTVVDLLFDRFDDEVTVLKFALAGTPRPDRARALIVAYVRFNSRHPEFFRILVLEGYRDTDRSQHVVQRMRISTDLWREAAGFIGSPSEDAMIDAFQVLGSTGTIFATMYFGEALYGVRTDSPEFIDRFATIISNTQLSHHGRRLIGEMDHSSLDEVV
jgi:AcrR family transcriptional regulator